jgi:hypothetical protein
MWEHEGGQSIIPTLLSLACIGVWEGGCNQATYGGYMFPTPTAEDEENIDCYVESKGNYFKQSST